MSSIHIAFFIIISFVIIYKANTSYFKEIKPTFTSLLFLIKILAALFFLYVYTYHYGGGELTADAGMFFKEAKVLNSVFHENKEAFFKFLLAFKDDPELIEKYLDATSHWNASERILPNDSRNVIRINSLILFISNGQIFIHFIIFSLFSFLGGIDLYQFIKKHSHFRKEIVLATFTILPSIAFWGSSIIKEPLMLLGLMLLIRAIFDDIKFSSRIWRIILGLILMLLFKPYVLFIISPFIILYLVYKVFRVKRVILVALSFFVIIFLVGQFMGANKKALNMISKQQEDFINLRDGGLYLIDDEEHYIYIYYNNRNKFEIEGREATLIEPTGAFYMKANENFNRKPIELKEVGKTWTIGVSLSEVGSGVPATPIDKSFTQLLLNIPSALWNSTIRPFPFDPGSWLKHLAFLENFILFASLFLVLSNKKKFSLKQKQILIPLVGFTFTLFVIVGLTTPVLGAIVRYKVPATLTLSIIVLVLAAKDNMLVRFFKKV